MKKVLFFSIFFLGALCLLVYSLEQSPHAFKEGDCVLCHQGTPASPASLTASSLTMACSGCHADILQSGFMHPVDVRPDRVKIPADFPLSRTGLIVCTTCHAVHEAPLDSLAEKTYFLRRPVRGRAFCASCHSQEILDGGGHQLVLAEAHFRSRYISTGVGQELDETSKNCISCHDGSFGSSVPVTGVWQHSSNYGAAGTKLGSKHPIGIDYEEARLKHGRKSDLRPLSMVDQRLQLYNGRLGCGTCHDPYSQRENDLVMGNEHSALCFGCHQME
jgi:predicted CXXCH cytochrome family protein